MMLKFQNLLLFISTTALLSSCGIYSFNGASIPTDAETIYVKYFNNKAETIQPSLSQIFTENLKDIFVKQTNLNLMDSKSDLNFSGYITEYKIQPIAITANETARKNRLTIATKVTYQNIFDEESSFEQTFSRYRDYESSQNISDIENELIEAITSELCEDIFNKAFVNW